MAVTVTWTDQDPQTFAQVRRTTTYRHAHTLGSDEQCSLHLFDSTPVELKRKGGPDGASVSSTVGTYAPGQWIEGHRDEMRSAADPGPLSTGGEETF